MDDKPPPPREPSAREREAEHYAAQFVARSMLDVFEGRKVRKVRKHNVDAKTAPLNDVAAAIKAKLELATCADNDAAALHQEAEDHRLEAAKMLVELRRRVEAEGCDWWLWAADGMKFNRTRKDVERLLRLGGADDPEAAIEHERAETRERMRRLRGAHIDLVRSIPEPEVPPPAADPIEIALAKFAAFEAAIDEVRGDNMRRFVNEAGEDRIFRIVSRLKQAIDDYGTPRRVGVKDAADRAEARSHAKVH